MTSERAIKRELTKKLNNFYDSIDPDCNDVLEALSRGTVAGGAIASYLQGEEPNDLDIYLRNKEDLVTVIDYYLKTYDLVGGDDYLGVKDKETSHFNSELVHYVPDDSGIKINEGGVYVYLSSSGRASVSEEEKQEKYVPVFVSSNSMTLSNGIQIITRFSGEPEQIIKNFDYAHTLNYYDIKNRELVLNKKALVSIMTKNLIYTGSLFPLCSLFRMRKFMDRGYSINTGQILKMVMQLNYLDLNDTSVLEEQLIGVDSTYMEMFISALNKAKREGTDISKGYVMNLIEEMFD